MWEVLPIYEKLLGTLEQFKTQYELLAKSDNDPINHLVLNIQLGWQKLDYYYSKLDNSFVYVAAFVLHPRFRWNKLEKMWKDRPEWITYAKQAFTEAWEYYRTLNVGRRALQRPPQQQDRDDFLDEFLQDSPDSDPSTPEFAAESQDELQFDEMDNFMNAKDTFLGEVSDPISFWVQYESSWPHVARMALDIYGIPPTEADNERLYSNAGDMVTKKRNRLAANTIGAVQCLRQWDKDNIIDWR